jgi:hypothetical protein
MTVSPDASIWVQRFDVQNILAINAARAGKVRHELEIFEGPSSRIHTQNEMAAVLRRKG